MFRLSLAAAAALSCLAPAGRAEAPNAPPPAPLSVIHYATDASALTHFEENPAVTRRMVDRVVCAAAGQPDVAAAWRSLVKPTDRLGIKVSAAGGRYFSSHLGIVEAVLAGLEQAGIARRRVVIWDRDAQDLKAAGFEQRRGGYQVASVPPVTGYDRTAVFSAPILGKLIWGDALFAEKQGKLGRRLLDADQLSSNSSIATVLSKQVTKVINIPVLSDEGGCGIAGAIYNMTVPNVDNWRRFTQSGGGGASGLLDLYADERVGGKVVLTIMDGLLAQYAGGPRFNPNYAFPYETILASKDPLALDANALRLIERWRREAKLPSIAREAAWLQEGAAMGLGQAAESRIILRAATAP